jgi:TetR/AcrR family transcriptional repressor of nem operon
MARPREFDRTQAVQAAMGVFWEHGFEGASLARLIEAMGISKSSFYDTFECKRALYLEAIRHYTETMGTSRASAVMKAHDNPLDGIRAVFHTVVDDVVSGNPVRGCFINNCCAETAPGDAECEMLLTKGLANVEHGFEIALRNAATLGKLKTHRDPKALAQFLAATLHGIIVVGKAKRDAAQLRNTADIALSMLS